MKSATLNEPAVRVIPEQVYCDVHDVWHDGTCECPFCVFASGRS